jgi:hypothetical protein
MKLFKRAGKRRSIVALVTMLVVAAGSAAAFAASGNRATSSKSLVVTVSHGALDASDSQYIDAGPAGPSVGDVRTFYVPLSRPARAGYATGTLTTVATGKPQAGMELRAANLVFVMGGPADQLVIGGVGAYPQSSSTISKETVVTRPVIGGSGTYAGARGWCVTTHHADDTWTHVFHVTIDRR